ncbi:serine hydrolase domain-containing protein [Streptomyces atacamensis]|uniref:serine hydrolase domain-containing protein n=1 Tax=Streptomyces atacamensis TaxID=531966 RepID=UPI00399CFB14
MSRRSLRTATTLAVAAALALTAVPAAASATSGPATSGPAAPADTAERQRHHGGHHAALRQAMDDMVDAGVPGVLAQARDGHGTWTASAGVADLDTGRPRIRPDRFRVGSITKTFVATVMLQLQQEGRLDLDDTVEERLPGVVRGNGHDGRRVTLRQLLNHTSGIFDYTSDERFGRRLREDFEKHRYDTHTPEQLVGIAMGHEPDFAPGTDWSYSNTNYVLAGMVIEAVTGDSYAHQIERRVLRPLGLRATVLPGTRATMPRPHGRAYVPFGGPGAELTDVTDFNPSAAWAAGEMVSTVDDLNRFLRALMTGRLLSGESMAEMFEAVPTGEQGGDRYGLGLQTRELSCGKRVWGHSGGIPGSSSLALATRDGGHSLALNLNAQGIPVNATAALEAEFCGTPAAPAPKPGPKTAPLQPEPLW